MVELVAVAGPASVVTGVAPLSTRPDLRAAGARAAALIAADAFSPSWSQQVVVPAPGPAIPDQPLLHGAIPAVPLPLRLEPPDYGAGKPGSGSIGGGAGAVPKARLGRADGRHLGLVYQATIVSGPAALRANMQAGQAALLAEHMTDPSPEGMQQVARLGPAVNAWGLDVGRGLQVQSIGAGGRLELGYAWRLHDPERSRLEVVVYADAASNRAEGGVMVSIFTN